MKLPLIAIALLFAACSSAPEAGGGAAAHEGAPTTLTLENQDGRVMANQMRLFLMDTDLRIESDGPAWDLSGTADEIDFARFLAKTFDTPTLTQKHRAMVKAFEEGGAKRALNAARGRSDWGASWVVGADSDDRWLAMIPDSDLSAFSEVLRSVRGGE